MATFFEKNPQRRAQWNPRRRNGNYTAAQYTIHSFEANVGTSALAGATILCTRPDPGSYHWLCDANGGYIHLAPWSAETWHSVPTNNWAVGGSIMMRAHQWRTLTDKQRRNIIHGIALGAARFSQWLISQGRDPVPARHLTRAQAMRKEAGFIFHRDTDPGRRSDPANPRDDFPWGEFYAEYHRLLGGTDHGVAGITIPTIPEGHLDMHPDELNKHLSRHAENVVAALMSRLPGEVDEVVRKRDNAQNTALHNMVRRELALAIGNGQPVDIDGLAERVAGLLEDDLIDAVTQTITALPGATPEQIKAEVRQDIANRLTQEA